MTPLFGKGKYLEKLQSSAVYCFVIERSCIFEERSFAISRFFARHMSPLVDMSSLWTRYESKAESVTFAALFSRYAFASKSTDAVLYGSKPDPICEGTPHGLLITRTFSFSNSSISSNFLAIWYVLLLVNCGPYYFLYRCFSLFKSESLMQRISPYSIL